MLVIKFLATTGLTAILPFLVIVGGSAHSAPPHLRHRHLANTVNQKHDAPSRHPKALTPQRANEAHRDAHQVIKRNVRKRQGSCTVRSISSVSASPSPTTTWADTVDVATTAPESSSSTLGQENWAHVKSSTESWSTTTTSSSDWSQSTSTASSWASATGGSSGASSGSAGGLLSVSDNTCGWCDSSDKQPNGSEDWLNCDLTGGGWTPPMVTLDQLIYVDLSADGIFSPCADYISIFESVGKSAGVPPILLASFAMQESTCNSGATGANGEQGLMQITPANCPSGDNCYDPWTNVQTGAKLLTQAVSSGGGSVVAAAGAYNGWYAGMTKGDAEGAAVCSQQQNLDYLHQLFNGWMQGKTATNMGTYFNLNHC